MQAINQTVPPLCYYDNMIVLSNGIYDQCRQLGREAYPFEACGLLLARSDSVSGHDSETRMTDSRSAFTDDQIHIAELLVAENIAPRDHQQRMYQLDPVFLLHAQRRCRERKREIVGIFHTHPDHPPVPSAADLAAAWPVYIYLILHVRADAFGSMLAWKLDSQGERFCPVGVRD